MIGNLEWSTLQQLWWLITSLVGSLFIFLTFVQGGQTLILTLAKNESEKSLIVNSLGRKWELTFTALVLFGGALYAAFPLFYATSFGGAYWVWIAILLTFVLQAISYEFRRKPNNFLGQRTYEVFLLINGTVGILLIGAAIGTFFTGSNFRLNDYSLVQWTHPLRGLEVAFEPFNVSFGLFLVFLARVLGTLYLTSNIEDADLVARLRKSSFTNLLLSLPFLLFVLYRLITMNGFTVDPASKVISLVAGKYLDNMLSMPSVLAMLLSGLSLVVLGAMLNRFTTSRRGIWPAGLGTVLTCLSVFFLTGYHNTPFYPSKTDLGSSLTIYNASSSHYTLTMMSYVAILVPFVLAYIAWVWRQMDSRRLGFEEVTGDSKSY